MSRKDIIRKNPMESFICKSCGNVVPPVIFGGQHRNHCPHCLSSLHLDIIPGDRRSNCKGIMEPLNIFIQKNKEWSIIHRCKKCNTIKMNRIAADDNELLLFSIASKPLLNLPFPSDSIVKTLFNLSLERGKENVEV